MITFEEYLESKKIDPKTFEKRDSGRFIDFKNLFEQVHPNSFTQQKLFLINRLRRSFPLKETKEEEVVKKVKQAKPKIAPRIKK